MSNYKADAVDANIIETSAVVKYQRMKRRWKEGIVSHVPEISRPPRKFFRKDHVEGLMTARWGKRYTDNRDLLARASRMEVIPDYPIHIDIDLLDSYNLACVNRSENYRPWTRRRLNLDALFSDPFFAKRKLCAANVGNATEPFIDREAALRAILRILCESPMRFASAMYKNRALRKC